MRWTPDSVSTGPHISPTFRPNAATSKSLRRAIRSNTSGLNSTRRRAGYVPLHLAGTEEAELAALAMRVAVALGARELHEGRLQLGGVAAGLCDDLRLEATRHVRRGRAAAGSEGGAPLEDLESLVLGAGDVALLPGGGAARSAVLHQQVGGVDLVGHRVRGRWQEATALRASFVRVTILH